MDSENREKIGNLCADLRAQVLGHEPFTPEDLALTLLVLAESIREIMWRLDQQDDYEMEQKERSG